MLEARRPVQNLSGKYGQKDEENGQEAEHGEHEFSSISGISTAICAAEPLDVQDQPL